MNTRAVMLRSNPISPDSRVEKEAAALKEFGYDVTIVGWDRDSNHKGTKSIINSFNQEIPIWRYGHKARFGAGMGNLIPFLKFQLNLLNWLIKNRTRYEVIHACDFDTAITSSIINIILKKKFIFDIFDYRGGDRKNIQQKILSSIQDKIINSSNATIICTEERKEQIKRSTPRKLTVIHNSPPKINFEQNKSEKENSKTKICYVGILQDYRLLKEIPEFFINHSEFELHIGGFGKYESLYESLSNKYPNIKFYGKLPYQDTLELERNCDIMLAIYDPSLENHTFAAPNKFYEALMIGKPIIMAKNTGMSSIVEDNNIGVTIDYSVRGFTEGVLFLEKNKDKWKEIGEKMHHLYNYYSWDEMKNRLCELYKSL